MKSKIEFFHTIISLSCVIPFIAVLSTVLVINYDLVIVNVIDDYLWFYSSISIAIIASVVIYVINIKTIEGSFPDILILIFCLSGLAVTYLSVKEFNSRSEILLLMLILYITFKILFSQNKNSESILVTSLILIGCYEAILGLKQLYGLSESHNHIFKVTGSFLNPGPFAGYLAVIFPFAVFYTIRHWSVLSQSFKYDLLPIYFQLCISFTTMAIIISILPSTMSRSSWIASFLGGGFVVLTLFFQSTSGLKPRYSLFKSSRIVIVAVGLSVVLIFGILFGALYNLKKDSADGRTLIYKISLRTIMQNKGGVGLGYFPGSYGNEQAHYFASGKGSTQEKYLADHPAYAFNDFIQICIEFGIVPFIIFLLIITGSIYNGIKNNCIGATGAMISFLVMALLLYPLNLLPFITIFVMLLALLNQKKLVLPKFSNPQANILAVGGLMKYRSVVIILFICMMIVFHSSYKGYSKYRAYDHWDNAKLLYNTAKYEEAASLYEQIVPILDDHPSLLFEYGQSLNKIKKYRKSNELLLRGTKLSCDPMFYNILGKNCQALKEYRLAENYYTKSINLVPNRIYPRYLLTKLYMHTGNREQAQKVAKNIKLMKPKVVTSATEEIKEDLKHVLIP